MAIIPLCLVRHGLSAGNLRWARPLKSTEYQLLTFKTLERTMLIVIIMWSWCLRDTHHIWTLWGIGTDHSSSNMLQREDDMFSKIEISFQELHSFCAPLDWDSNTRNYSSPPPVAQSESSRYQTGAVEEIRLTHLKKIAACDSYPMIIGPRDQVQLVLWIASSLCIVSCMQDVYNHVAPTSGMIHDVYLRWKIQ